jgi:predicted membrane protein
MPAAQDDPGAPPVASTVFGDLRRSGVWRVPAYSSWSTVLGDVRLDLREAHIERSPVTIHTRTIFGGIEVLVPEGVAVDLRVTSLLGTVRQLADAADPAAPRVVVTGRTIFGEVRVLHQRLHERLVDRLLGPRRGAS